ncbi:hypothetical protein M378DRAFT_163416 [Amanita muscaria Koide BX008]|uniref:Uncharacterized protein n=1 Tax=Amanita muscaria (strain Koide BX008) TaxID=946122 RepID=A0A0C2TC32_AMAMK|nr:hypothetical protein M378DRAFT_163416 [Amanita muscaria Koide BX008]
MCSDLYECHLRLYGNRLVQSLFWAKILRLPQVGSHEIKRVVNDVVFGLDAE